MEDDFEDLADITPQGTIKAVLPHFHVRGEKPLVLIMKYAGASNPAYQSGKYKIQHELDAAAMRGDDQTQRDLIHGLFARAVVIGWENAFKKDGTPLPYSAQTAVALFAQVFNKGGDDELALAFAQARDPNNFRRSPEVAAQALGK